MNLTEKSNSRSRSRSNTRVSRKKRNELSA